MERIDVLLVKRGLCDSREQAKRLVMAGEISVGTHRILKPSFKVAEDADLKLAKKPKYVGRGGLKLEGALDFFKINPADQVCLDVGASTGGFTDCLLQRGARLVHTVDVGTNQLAWKIRSDPRVIAKEKFNARYLTQDDLGESIASLIVMDLSFISLTKILPAIFGIAPKKGDIICLIKPQFELTKEEVGKGGVVRDPKLHQKAVEKIQSFVTSLGHHWGGHLPSPIKGATGNQEFLAWIQRGAD